MHGHAENRSLVSGEDPHGGRAPHAHGLVGAGRDDRLVVGQHRDPGDRRLVLGHPLELPSARRFPEPHRLVGRARGDPAAVVGQGTPTRPARCGRSSVARTFPSATFQTRAVLSVDPVTSLAPSRLTFKLKHGIRVAAEIADALSLIDVPELGGLVGRGREQQIAVLERISQCVNPSLMPLELLDGLAIGGVDHADRVVLARDGKLAAVAPKGDRGNRRGQRLDLLHFLAVARLDRSARSCSQGPPRASTRLAGMRPRRPVHRSLISLINLPSAGFQIRMTLSPPAVASFDPSFESAKASTGPFASIVRGAATGSCHEPRQPVRARRDDLLVVRQIRQGEDGLARVPRSRRPGSGLPSRAEWYWPYRRSRAPRRRRARQRTEHRPCGPEVP